MLRAALPASLLLAAAAAGTLRGPAQPARAAGGGEPPAVGGAGFVTNAERSKSFAWTATTRTAEETLDVTFPKGAGWPNACFSEGKGACSGGERGAMTRARVAQWVDKELLGGPDPFGEESAGHVPVPWPAQKETGDQLGDGQYVGYSRRQVCFIVAKTLLGAGTAGYANGLTRILNTTVPWCGNRIPSVERNTTRLSSAEPTALTGEFGMNLWHLLAACAADPTLAHGGQGPLLLAAKGSQRATVSEVRKQAQEASLKDAHMGICRYNDGDAGPLEHPMLEHMTADVCTPPTFNAPGRDFQTGGPGRTSGQAMQDISAKFLGGYVFGTACGLGGGQDERLMTYLPEVFALSFFLSQAEEHPQLREPAWILGARILLIGLDGTARFNTRLELDAAVPMTSDLVEVELGGQRYSMSGSAPFLAFMSETQDFLNESSARPFEDVQRDLFAARRNAHPLQRAVGAAEWYSFMYQVRAWYSAVALTSYSPAVRPALKAIVKSLGTGPWLAGLWWGDSQLGFLAVWIGQAIAARTWGGRGLPLQYYVYADFTENPGNQCFVHSEKACLKCLARCAVDPLPATSYWLPDYAYMRGRADKEQSCVVDSDAYCGQKGLEHVLAAYGRKKASELWEDIEATLAAGPEANTTVFDLLLA